MFAVAQSLPYDCRIMPKPETISFYRRRDNTAAAAWEKRLIRLIRKSFPKVRVVTADAQATVVLGGDGTIIEAVRLLANTDTLFLGLNLGTVGFLAAERKPAKFERALRTLLTGKAREERRMGLSITVRRRNREVYATTSLNEASVMNPMGMVGIDVSVDGHLLQHVHGSGIMVSTPTGSTAFNLSAHGPIIDPRIECMVVTEILDHSVPTPSIVIPPALTVSLRVTDFRKRGTIIVAGRRSPADVVLAAGGWAECALEKDDVITVRRAPSIVRFAQVNPHHFYISLHEKFSLT